MIEKLDLFYSSREEPYKGCLLALRDIILRQDPLVSETVKYGMPCFTYGKKAFCYLWQDKKTLEPYILMVEGKLIDHPSLEEGSRAKMKILRVSPTMDLPLETIELILHQALNLYR